MKPSFSCVVDQELTKREVEYVALSRDTTETDLKQRREIRSGTAFYIDQVNPLPCGILLQTGFGYRVAVKYSVNSKTEAINIF